MSEADEGLSEETRRVIELALEEALRLGHPEIGTEHLLLGILLEGGSTAAELLIDSGVEVDDVREIVGGAAGDEGDPEVELPFTPRAKACLRRAIREARRFGSERAEPEHLLLSILGDEDGVAARSLVECDVSIDDVREAIESILSGELPEEVRSGAARPRGPSEETIRALFEISGLEIPPEFEAWFEATRRVDRLVQQAEDLRTEKARAIEEERYERAAQIQHELARLDESREEALSQVADVPPGLSVESILVRQNRRVIELLEAIVERLGRPEASPSRSLVESPPHSPGPDEPGRT